MARGAAKVDRGRVPAGVEIVATGTAVTEIALELCCGQCGTWWLRWTVDCDRPLEDQLSTAATGERYLEAYVNGRDTVQHSAPGGYQRASDGRWYRWTPGATGRLREGETYGRMEFRCPNGCAKSNVQVRNQKLDAAVVKALRAMHAMRMPLLRMTVDKLLASVA
jgi:hypothetical protein